MNKYKIELKTNLNKEIIIAANNEKEALEFIEKAFLKTNLLDFSNKDILSVDARIIEKNDQKIEEYSEENDENSCEEMQEILEETLDKIREEIPEEEREYYCPESGYPLLIDEIIEEFYQENNL